MMKSYMESLAGAISDLLKVSARSGENREKGDFLVININIQLS